MMPRFALPLSLVLLVGLQRPPEEDAVRFSAIDVYADAGEKGLAAYQIEILCAEARSRIVGVEGGETKHYSEAPYHDPAALQGGRIIIGAFTTEEKPPAGRTRVARIHFQETGPGEPRYTARLMAAASPGGARVDAKIDLLRTGGSK